MYHHVELFRLRPGVSLAEVRRGFTALAELVETLPGVEHYVVTENRAEPKHGYSMVLFSMFVDRSAYEIYTRHPAVRDVWAEHLERVVEERLKVEGESGS